MQQPQQNSSRAFTEQHVKDMDIAEGSTPGHWPQCMDAELQWDAAILTVMVERHADAAEPGKTLLHLSSPSPVVHVGRC